MNKSIVIVIIIFTLAIIATYFPWQQTEETATIIEDQPVTEADNILTIPKPDQSPAIEYPVPAISEIDVIEEDYVTSDSTPETKPVVVEPQAPLPQLDESDDDIAAAVEHLLDGQTAVELFSFKTFIRHFVVTIDNLTNQKLPQRYGFTRSVSGSFIVTNPDVDTATLDNNNFKRYANFVSLAERVDSRKLAAYYVKFYPLFQEAYESLGYPDRYFNDRFIQVINHLLDAPEINQPVALIRPKVFWKFADPELESLSSGQKIMLRIGYDNAQRVKAKLRELRGILTTFKPG